MLYDHQIWPLLDVEDLWVYDKLILSKKLGQVCGPVGVPVPYEGIYVVKPITNIEGMGKDAKLSYIKEDTEHLPTGHFWQELYTGRHLSVDFLYGKQIRCTEGYSAGPSRFYRWCVVDETPSVPQVLMDVISRYEKANIEFIGPNIIEAHLRGNPDFEDGAVEIIPVWKDNQFKLEDDRFVFVKAKDGDRVGFYKRYK